MKPALRDGSIRKVHRNVALSKSHVLRQCKTPRSGGDALPGRKGTESAPDVELPGVNGDKSDPTKMKPVEHDLDNKQLPTVTSANQQP